MRGGCDAILANVLAFVGYAFCDVPARPLARRYVMYVDINMLAWMAIVVLVILLIGGGDR